MNVPYVALMISSVAVGLVVSRLSPRPLPLSRGNKAIVMIGAVAGGCLGAKLPFLLQDPAALRTIDIWFENGRTITYGLVGGYLGVEAAKFAAGIRVKTGDSLAAPLAASIAVGRLGCFVGGCCFGTPTDLPWGHDFGDGISRHPTQIYEAIFHACAAIVLFWLGRRQLFQRQLVKAYIATYLVYRFITEIIRPEPRLAFGLTFYQWSVLPMLALFACLAWSDRPSSTQSSMTG